MRIGFGTVVGATVVVVAVLVGILMFGQPSASPPNTPATAPAQTGPRTLQLYVAAGLQPPVREIIKAYEASHQVQFETQYGGSGSLLSQIIVSGGDLFLAADRLYLDEASQKNLGPEIIPLAYQYPVIVVLRGNPKHVSGLKDLMRTDVRLSLADPQRAAISKVVSDLLKKDEQWEPLYKKAIIHRETVSEVGNDVKLAAADAGIVWNATVAQFADDLLVVHVPEFDRAKSEIAVGLLASSKDPKLAQQFIDYLRDPNEGLRVLAKHGYVVIDGKPPAKR